MWALIAGDLLKGGLESEVCRNLFGGKPSAGLQRRCFLLRPSQEFRADPDATTALEGETRTALQVALRSLDRRVPTGIAELVRHGARLMNTPIKKYLPPWTAEKIQAAEPQDTWSQGKVRFLSFSLISSTALHDTVAPEDVLARVPHLKPSV